MLKPINKHIVVEPVVNNDFVSAINEKYQEIGTVISVSEGINDIPVGCKVYFDSWMTAKFPKSSNEYYWLVKYEDIRGYDNEQVSP